MVLLKDQIVDGADVTAKVACTFERGVAPSLEVDSEDVVEVLCDDVYCSFRSTLRFVHHCWVV